jgi:hypothetical protein
MADKEPELAAAAGRVSDGAPTAADDAAKVAEELELVAVVSECMGKIIMDIIKKAIGKTGRGNGSNQDLKTMHALP